MKIEEFIILLEDLKKRRQNGIIGTIRKINVQELNYTNNTLNNFIRNKLYHLLKTINKCNKLINYLKEIREIKS